MKTIFLALSLVAFAGTLASAPPGDEGLKPIFDGRSLEGWDGDPRFWKVEGGAIVGQTTDQNPTKGNTFLVWRQGELDDFELTLEYRMAGGNSGVQVRSWEDEKGWGKWVIGGYQADIDSTDHYTGIIYGERYRGILANRGEKTVIGADHKPKVAGKLGESKEIQARFKKDDWNRYRITARGNRIALEINGTPTAETVDEDKEARRSGLLALQLHAGPSMRVEFRDIRLKRLPLGDKKKIVLIAGKPSHGSGDHEHNGGCAILARCLNESVPSVFAAVYKNGWPQDPTALDNADAAVMYCDGGGGHMVNPHLEAMDAVMKKGVGLACLHYGVEVPKGKSGDRFLDWIGGYFETHWSVNPHWTAKFEKLPEHPITRGVKPFSIHDEWYYHMRFREGLKGVTPILSAVPPEETRNRPDGPHSGNEHVRARKGLEEVVAWAAERPDGGRGFGFTGGHVHWNWGNDDFRKLVLNALVWIAKGDVPTDGVGSRPVSREELEEHLDPKPGRKPRTASASGKDGEGWIDLFPGKDLRGWRRVPIDPLASKPVWTVSEANKVLLIDGVGAKEILLHEEERGDGTLRVEWRFMKQEAEKPVYNGGVYVRTSLDGKTWVQAQVAHADKPPVVGDLFGMTPVAGQVQRTEVIQKSAESPARPPGEWNVYEIDCRGKRVSLSVNGKITATWEDCGIERGHLGLQAEFSPIEVKAIRFRPAK